MNIHEQVLVELRKIIRAIDLHSKHIQKTSGVTGPQLLVLKVVSKVNEITTGNIAKEVNLSQATVTSILDRLESKEYVHRVRSTTDKRKVFVSLTKRGQDLINIAPPLLQDKIVNNFANLSTEEQQDIFKSLKWLSKVMGANEMDASSINLPASEKIDTPFS